MSVNLGPVSIECMPVWKFLLRHMRKYGITSAIRMAITMARIRTFNPFGVVEIRDMRMMQDDN